MATAPRVVAVALFCLAAHAQPPTLQVSKTSLTFSGDAGGDSPARQAIVVTSGGQGPVRFTVSDNASWLSFTPSAAATPARIQVTVDPSDLAAGSYQTRILISDPANAVYGPIVIPVAFTVDTSDPVLDVSPGVMRFAGREQGFEQDDILLVRNIGGGGRFNFTVSLQTPSPWIVSVTPSQGFAGPNLPFPVKIRVSPQGLKAGAYRTVLHFTSTAGVVDVPVLYFVGVPGPSIFLNPRGFRFEVRQGAGTSLTRQVSILNKGSDSLDWTAEVVQGGDWLKINRTSGTSTPDNPGTFRVSTDDTRLLAGTYYGLVRVSAPQALNSPHLLPVVLSVADAASAPIVGLAPAGLFFAAVSGQPPPPGQILQIYASSAQSVAYQGSGYTVDGLGWLSLSGVSGVTATQRTGQITVSVNHAALKPGVFTGEVTLSYSSSDVRSANVTLVVLPAGAKLSSGERAATGCTPTRLTLTQSALASNFSAAVGWPTPLIIQLTDDCGAPVLNGQVVATYSNGDPAQSMTLADSTDGSYSATWIPAKAGGSVSITARAISPNLPAVAAQIAGSVLANKVPILFDDGTVDNFSFLSAGPLAPGTMAALFGSDLATGVKVLSTNPLPTDVDGTRVLVGGIEAPVKVVTPGQLVAQIPAELEPNRLYQVLVSVNGALTLSDTIAVTAVQPSVQAPPPNNIVAAQHADFSAITATSPAKPGEPILLYVQGMGSTSPPARSGFAASTTTLANAVIQPTVTVDGKPAEVFFAGASPGSVGLHQINLFVPPGARSGNLDIAILQGGVASNPGVLPVRQ